MFRLKNNWMWVSWCVVVTLLLSASCSGSAISPLGESEATTEVVASQPAPASDAIVLAEPPSPRLASAPANPGDEVTEQFDWLGFYLKHVPLESGENDVDVTQFLYRSANAFIDHDDIYLNHVDLHSTETEMSYVTYGFRNIPEGENIVRVEIFGDGIFGDGPFNGLYIGISNAAKGTYEWAGPFQPGMDWALDVWNLDSADDNNRAYMTFAVYGGDMAEIRELKVWVNGMQVMQAPELEFMFDYVRFTDPIPGTVPLPGVIPGPRF